MFDFLISRGRNRLIVKRLQKIDPSTNKLHISYLDAHSIKVMRLICKGNGAIKCKNTP